MAKLRILCLELGDIETNTYLVWNEETRECILIDPSDGAEEIVSAIEKEKLTPKAIWLTHGHVDHFGSVNELKRKYGLLTYMMKEEEEVAISIRYNLSTTFGDPRVVEGDMFFVDGQMMPVLGTSMKAMLTPGHTPGGGCYYFPEEKMVFTGDTLFRGSIGRSDFPGGDMETLIRSIRDKLMCLDDDTMVLPGHGPSTTIGHERAYNYFLNEAVDLETI